MPIPKLPDRDKRVERIKSQIPIADVIGSEIALQRAGSVLRGLCPFHDDHDPSLVVYEKSFHCFGCRISGDHFTFVQKQRSITFPQAVDWLENRIGKFEPTKIIPTSKPQSSTVTPEIVEYYHSMLADEHRDYFYSRLFTDATIDRELWGWDGKRYAIPVWAGRPQESDVLGIRLRKASGDGPKYIGVKGSNDAALYNSWAIANEPGAFIAFGEFDAALMTQDGLPAVSPTNGAATWLEEWNGYFDGKDAIVIVPDTGEERFAYALMEQLGLDRCRVCSIPAFCGKDFTEFRQLGFSKDDLLLALKYQQQKPVRFEF